MRNAINHGDMPRSKSRGTAGTAKPLMHTYSARGRQMLGANKLLFNLFAVAAVSPWFA